MQIKPYIAFDGNAADAIAYYCQALDAECVFSLKFGDMPEQPDWVTDANKDRLAHGTIRLEGQEIYMSDTAGFAPHKGFSGITIQIACDTLDDGKRIFDALAQNGTVQMAFEPTFWAKGFGVLTDKFGVPWMINVD